jgi:hypothetical protein
MTYTFKSLTLPHKNRSPMKPGAAAAAAAAAAAQVIGRRHRHMARGTQSLDVVADVLIIRLAASMCQSYAVLLGLKSM